MKALGLVEQVTRLAEEMAEDDYRKRSGQAPRHPFDDYTPTDDDAPPWLAMTTAEDDTNPSLVALSISDVLDQWRTEGPLIHEPTGIQTLDEHTDGGPVYGSRWFVVGAPDAGKTGALLQIGHHMAENGVCVGFLAVDEEPGDLLGRFVQRSGWCRKDCETRFPDALDAMDRALRDLPIRFYNGGTLETAAADLAVFAKERAGEDRSRACLIVDSLQTVSCNAELAAEREMSERAAVTARAIAVRSVATRHRLIVLCTSEMNRSGYRTREAAETANDMATAAESRAVEYQGRVVLALRSVAGETDLVEVRIPKNKHRPVGVDASERMYLRLDRESQTFTETNYTPPPEPDKDARRREKALSDAAKVAGLILDNPGIKVRQLRSKAHGAGVSHDRTDAALQLLGDAVEREEGKRNAVHMTLDTSMLPTAVAVLMEAEEC